MSDDYGNSKEVEMCTRLNYHLHCMEPFQILWENPR